MAHDTKTGSPSQDAEASTTTTSAFTKSQEMVTAPTDGETTEADLPAEPASEQPVDLRPNYSSFGIWEKRFIVLASAIAALFSPLSAQIYFPALNTLADEFHVTPAQINFTVTTYMIFQGITPMFVGSFADNAGRRPAYIICFVIYIGANIGLALAPTYASLLVLRCLQSAGSSSTVALCSAVVADIVTSAERGQYIGITVIPVILAPSLGPVIGGLLSSTLGWRSIFWFLTIFAGVTLVVILFFLPETCRRLVGDGSIVPHAAYRTFTQLISEWRSRRQRRRQAKGNGADLAHTSTSASATTTVAPTLRFPLPNPFSSLLLLFEPELGLLLGYSSIVFAGFYAVATAIPVQIASIYGYSDLRIGLIYLPLAGGSVVAAFVFGPMMNWNYKRHCLLLGIPYERSKQQDLSDFPIERVRLELGFPMLMVAAATLVGWGWALQASAPIAVPCVLLFLLGATLIGFSNTTSVLIVDINPTQAGTATAANNLTRCLVGAGASAAIVPLVDAIGSGWAFSLIGALYVFFAPCLWFVVRYGIPWRKRAKEKEAAKGEKKAVKLLARKEKQGAADGVRGGAIGGEEKGDQVKEGE